MRILFDDHNSFLIIGPNDGVQVFGIVFQEEEVVFRVELAVENALGKRQAIPLVIPEIDLIRDRLGKNGLARADLLMRIGSQKVDYLLRGYAYLVRVAYSLTRY